MAVSLTEYLTEIQELTKKNFEILKALNDSFYTKSEHLSVTIDNTNYVIPSFISLENKLNTLEDNFENLVNAPRTGEAVFTFDGNTQEIEVKGFTNVPRTAFYGLDMSKVEGIKNFGYKKNEIFKDFLTPTPFVKINLANLPNDVHQLNVKKIVLKNETLISLLKDAARWETADETKGTKDSVCKHIAYADVVKKLFAYEDGKDYITYDRTYTLPLRYELGNGTYVIKEISNNWTDENFFEHYELKLDNLVYRIADETIERNLRDGDYLVTNNDKVKLLVEAVNTSANTVQVKVENGGFADLCTENDGNKDLSTLKFYALGNIKLSKYLDVPLEEDQYIIIFLAPIQRNSLVQSAWADGLMFNVFGLTTNDGQSYEDFYNTIVTNIGDKLFGIVSMATKDFVNVGEAEFERLKNAKPILDTNQIKVVLINKHMSNSETVQEIYNLYKQKEDYKIELSSVQKEIDEINSLLSSLSFEDTTTSRTIYTDQLSALSEKKKELTSNIANCIQQITVASTDTDTPVENPKYHIRGFFDYENFISQNNLNGHNVIKIDVEYRYKNANRVTGNAETIGPDGYIFSDWNKMTSFINTRHPVYNGGNYKYELNSNTSGENVPSFNQFDIPISQGETVDVRFRVVYEVGYPFVVMTSEWSDVTNIEFPIELRKNITVLDILKENNSDTTKEAFRGYLEKEGLIEHVSDKLVDQNVTFYHTPEHIASGFYTAERRVIPLRDKLQTLTDDIVVLKDEVYGSASENILVTLSDGETEVILNSFADNTFILKDYSSSDKIQPPTGASKPKVETTLTLNIQNTSKTNTVKLFSMFPGNKEVPLQSAGVYQTKSKFDVTDFVENTVGDKLCVPMYVDDYDVNDSNFISQVHNQWLYFRIRDAYNGDEFYKAINTPLGDVYFDIKNVGFCDYNGVINAPKASLIYPVFFNGGCNGGMCVFPHLTSIKDICMTDSSNYKLLKPGESIQVNLNVMYYLSDDATHSEVEKIMAFDLRNSLYADPITYKFALRAKYGNSLANNTRQVKKNRYKPVIIN